MADKDLCCVVILLSVEMTYESLIHSEARYSLRGKA